MKSYSDSYLTYAEYARRSLLRLRVVRGMSDELIVAVVIRGITDPQARAAATSANLPSEGLVRFLSLYTKPLRPRSLKQNQVKKTDLVLESEILSNAILNVSHVGKLFINKFYVLRELSMKTHLQTIVI